MAENVDFGGTKLMGFLGIVGGVVMAIGVPWVALSKAAEAAIGGFAATFLSVIGVLGGASLSVVAAFFSIVMPSKVGKGN